MIKFFYATGDSFVFGHELNENGPEADNASLFEFSLHKRKHCYTGIMSDKLNVGEYQNTGCPGGSNERAYRCLITDISEKLKIYKPEEIFVNVSLTHVLRREFCFGNSASEYYIHMNAFEPNKDMSPNHHRLWEVLVKKFNCNYGHFTFDMMIVLGIQNFLRTNKIPYLLTSSMGVEHSMQESIIPNELLNQLVKNRYYVSPAFNIFANEHNCKIGPMLHPLEEGHAVWADHLLKHIDENNLLDNSDL
jgi:hypothetical protein